MRTLFRPALPLMLASAAIAVASVACESSSDSKPPTPGVNVARRVDVEMRDFSFSPTSFEAPQSYPFNITAKNVGATRHTLNVYKDAAFTIPLSAGSHIEVAPGAVEAVFVKFDDLATYYFRCEIHPQQMQGQVQVKSRF